MGIYLLLFVGCIYCGQPFSWPSIQLLWGCPLTYVMEAYGWISYQRKSTFFLNTGGKKNILLLHLWIRKRKKKHENTSSLVVSWDAHLWEVRSGFLVLSAPSSLSLSALYLMIIMYSLTKFLTFLVSISMEYSFLTKVKLLSKYCMLKPVIILWILSSWAFENLKTLKNSNFTRLF